VIINVVDACHLYQLFHIIISLALSQYFKNIKTSVSNQPIYVLF